MEVEERLSLEQNRCETVIKTRVATLEEKYLQSKTKESEMSRKYKETVAKCESLEKEIRVYTQRHKDQIQEIAKLNSDNNRVNSEKRGIEEECKRLK